MAEFRRSSYIPLSLPSLSRIRKHTRTHTLYEFPFLLVFISPHFMRIRMRICFSPQNDRSSLSSSSAHTYSHARVPVSLLINKIVRNNPRSVVYFRKRNYAHTHLARAANKRARFRYLASISFSSSFLSLSLFLPPHLQQ